MSTGAEAAVLRRTRLRLIAWSAGTTLAVLVVLGVAIYVAAASSLAAEGTRQLEDRLAEMSGATTSIGVGSGATTGGGLVVTNDPTQPGVMIGGKLSGTIGIVTSVGTAGGASASMSGVSLGVTAPFPLDQATLARASAGETVVIETTMQATPVRVVVGPVGVGAGAPSVVGPAGGGPTTNSQPAAAVGLVIGDRTAEVNTLRTLLLVLLGGGVLVLGASVGVGYVYAGRALVPIREALRRQREFAADASHELRTPLAIARAAVAAARVGRADPSSVDRALDDLDAGVGRMESLVDDLLLLARADAEAVELDLGETDLALAAAEAAEGLESLAASRGVRLVLDVQPAPLRGDERRLRQLATILIDNAIRHSPSGGRVTVVVRPGPTLVVDDEGAGIAPEHLEHVFERFWRAPDAAAGGTGLGLAIARWIADRHGGTISAGTATPGTGARFTVRLPAR